MSHFEDAPHRKIPELVEKSPKQKKDATATKKANKQNVLSYHGMIASGAAL